MKAYQPSPRRIPELDGLRVLLVFVVSWYHFWQQSWLTPYVGGYSLDFLLRAGYMLVDGTIFLSGFLLFLPYARAMLMGENVPEPRSFYQRRVMRIVPSYYFITLLLLFVVALPWGLYSSRADMLRDVAMHLTFTQTFHPATYIATPIGVASWTVAIEMQAYLLFPWIARAAMKNLWGTTATLAAVAFAFRSWCLWQMKDYNMVVNQLPNLLDLYALGILCAVLYVRLTQAYPRDRRAFVWQAVATCLLVLAVLGMERLLRAQASSPDQVAIQAGQMVRRPLFGLLIALMAVSLPFCVRPVRLLMGNPLMHGLAAVSMNYYLIHQNLAVHLKRLHIPPSVSELPNMAGEVAWMYPYTYLCFGLSLLGAVLVTLLVEKPAAWLLKRLFARWNGRKRRDETKG